jgi:hypothetical protein
MSRSATTTVIGPLGDAELGGQDLRQPNDRDEASTDAGRIEELAPVQRDQMERARRDAESGQRDTDCRSMPQPADGVCVQPDDPTLLDTGLAPQDPRASEAGNRRTDRHDPGSAPFGPGGERRDGGRD